MAKDKTVLKETIFINIKIKILKIRKNLQNIYNPFLWRKIYLVRKILWHAILNLWVTEHFTLLKYNKYLCKVCLWTRYFVLILSMNFCFVNLRWTPTLPRRIHFHKNLNMYVTLPMVHLNHGFAKARLPHVCLILFF